jgi:hypothetical protein
MIQGDLAALLQGFGFAACVGWFVCFMVTNF